MFKIVRNVYAYFKGSVFRLIHPLSVKGIIRLFNGVSLRMYKGCSVSISKGVKVDQHAVIAVQKKGSLMIGKNVGIGPFNYIVCHKMISIGEGTILGPGVYIYDHDHIFDEKTGVDPHNYKCDNVIIGKNCWIGANTIILKGTIIGDNCLVAAGSVLKGNYPRGSKIIQKRNINIANER